MIVDDSVSVVELLKTQLTGWGFRHVEGVAHSGSVADRCHADPPDLLLLDLDMPDPNGLEILRLLRDLILSPVPLPVLVLTGMDTPEARHQALLLGARDFLPKPFDAVEIQLRVTRVLELHAFQLHARDNELRLEERVRERTAQLEEARIEVVRRLGRAGEFRDDETGEHTRRVGLTAALLGESLDVEREQVEALRHAAPLHDIGKIGVPDAILLKPGELTPAELTAMRRHTVIGADLLGGSSSGLLDMARVIALTHHERWDGSGYPGGLSGTKIPLPGRIVALADVFDALTHVRPYKLAWRPEDAVAEIAGQAGRHFDPAIVDAFLRLDQAKLV
jgi:putative two-component system response regulator